MKKRLRKKRRLGEFREDCFEVTFRTAPPSSNDDFLDLLDRFTAMIGMAGLQCGGGGGPTEWSGVVELCGRGSTNEGHRQLVLSWLNQQTDVLSAGVGKPFDAWHDLS